MIYLELWGIYEAAFFANERGVLGADEWSRFEKVICIERRGQLEDIWDQRHEELLSFKEILTPLFGEYVEENCQ
jgi:hypothetical protein